jgi:hypothetical protein
MKVLTLSNGAQCKIDEENFVEFSKYSWHVTAQGYAARRKTIARGISCIVTMHEEVLTAVTKRGVLVIDHINQDKLDNRKENLRLVTNQENQINRKAKAKGVSFDRTHKKYKAYYDKITLGQPKKRINLGTFSTEEAALSAVENYKRSLL